MQHLLFFWLFITAPATVMAQKTDTTSAISPWQHVRIQRSAVYASSVSSVRIFNEPFLNNEHHWPTGQSGGFSYTLADGVYSIRRVGKRDGKSGRAFIMLPDSVDLNRADVFVIEVDMLGSPECGLLFGLRDATTYGLFVLRNQTEFMRRRVVDGSVSSGDGPDAYQPIGKAVVIHPQRNTLRVEKHDGKLFFAINGQDVPGDPVPFRKFKGNGIGFISSADAVSFQNLRITVGTL